MSGWNMPDGNNDGLHDEWPEPVPGQCCDDPTPGEHDGRRYCEACDSDLS